MLVKKDRSAIISYFEDSSNLKGGHADGVAFPENIDELSGLLAGACRKNTPITASGGGTATTGSRIPFGGMVVSLEKMNRISDISEISMAATAEAGVMVDEFKNACEKKGLFYTCHPTERLAFLGGTIATNASGARSFRYGSTRRYVKRLKMVLADGEIFELARGEQALSGKEAVLKLNGSRKVKIPMPAYKMPDVKNSAGYYVKDGMDAIDLFIGQEGTLSIIAEADFALMRLPSGILSSFVFFRKAEDSWAFAAEARTLSRRHSGGIDALSIEYIGPDALALLRAKNKNVPVKASAAIFFEQELPEKDDGKVMDAWLRLIKKHNASADETWVAMTQGEEEELNKIRHSIPESVNEIVRVNGYSKLSTDIAVPEKNIGKMMDFYFKRLKGVDIQHVIFGHIGECHLHVNLLPRNDEELRVSKDICMEFYRMGVSLGGTVSAEHGIGKIRKRQLEFMYGHEGILQMVRVKKALDPNCILGLDNLFDKELLKLA